MVHAYQLALASGAPALCLQRHSRPLPVALGTVPGSARYGRSFHVSNQGTDIQRRLRCRLRFVTKGHGLIVQVFSLSHLCVGLAVVCVA